MKKLTSFTTLLVILVNGFLSLILGITEVNANIGDVGHWRDSVGNQIPGTTFGGFNFNQQIRNDGIYSKPNDSTVQVSEAGDYLVLATTHDGDTSNGRYSSQLRIQQIAGTGNIFSSYYTGYSRSAAEDESWTRAIGVIIGASANSQFQVQKRRDSDAPTGGSLVNNSDIQVIRLTQTNYGIYGIGGTGNRYGGTTPNTVDVDSIVSESNTTAIQGNTGTDTVTIKGDNKKYLVAWSTSFTTGGNRTQRIGHLEYDGVDKLSTRSYCYSRNTANEYCGLGSMDIIETSSADITIQAEVFRGIGVAADQGGANNDGNLGTDGNGQMIVLELPESVDAFASQDSTGLQNLSTAQTLNIARNVNFADAESFTKTSDTQVSVTAPADVFSWANIWAARGNIITGNRQTSYGSITIDGVEQTTGRHGDYSRGNQGSSDTFAIGFQPGGFFKGNLPGYTLGVTTDPIIGGAGGGTDRTQPNTLGFFALNLDTFVLNTPPTDIALSNNIRDENILAGSVIGTFSTTDADAGDIHVYNFVTGTGDTDNGAFTITGNTLSINTSPDFETQSSYSIRIQTYDEHGGSYEEVFIIDINDLDEVAPVITLVGSDPETVFQGSTYIDAGATCTDDVDAICTTIDDSSSVDSTNIGTYIVTYDAVDAAGNNAVQVTRMVNVVIPPNFPPTDILLSNDNLDENVASSTIVGTLSSIDADIGDAHTYNFVTGIGDTDNADFMITGNTLSINISPDFEIQSSYSIRVETDDGNGGNYEKVFTITIDDLDEIPPVIVLSGDDMITIVKNSTYTELGATCSDDVDISCIVNIGGATVDSTTIGSYLITYNATDFAGNNAIQLSRSVHVVPGDVPIITLSGSTSETIEVLSLYTDAGATATDSEDGDITSNIVIVNPVDTSATGSYIVSYNVDDSSDNSAIEVTRTVNVVDNTPPELTLLGSTPINIIKNATYGDAGAIANDGFEGDISSEITIVNPVDTTLLGTYTVTYNVSDSSGNAATQVTRTVNVVSGDIPIITRSGSGILTVEVGSTYIDAGATATDSEDGDITTNIVTVNPVDTSATGSYIVSYNVSDSSDNDAIEISRIVNVVDTTAPIITRMGSDTINLVQGEIFSDPGATCIDNFDPICNIVVGGASVDTTRVGTYIITYDAEDISGNNAIQLTRTVNITAAPLLINEVEYDTPGNESEAEWFEIYNPTDYAVNIDGWTITEKVGASSSKTFTFGSQIIPAGAYIVITNETFDFQLVYPSILPDVDLPGVQYFNLKNSPDDSLILADPFANNIDEVLWENPSAGWGIEAIDKPICRLLVPDTDSVANWSADCIPTPQAINDFNAPPIDIILSNDNFDENNSSGLIVGTFTTTDGDSSDTHMYSLTTGSGDIDNGSFTLSGNVLIFNAVADYEFQNSYSILIQTDDGKAFGIYEEMFHITINDINTAPTDISISGNDIDENNLVGDTIGILSGNDDGEDMNNFIFSLSCAIPGTDDSFFNIIGTNLNAGASYDFETQSTFNICIRLSDGILSYDENFMISINDLDEENPVVTITAATKLQNSSIIDTSIQVIDNVGINAADIMIGSGSSVGTSSLNCSQTSSVQVDCSISIDSSGDLVIEAYDTSGNGGSDVEVNYIVDSIAPNIPNVNIDTTGGFSVNNPELSFSSLDNVGVDYYTITYNADDGGTGTGIPTTINPATSPITLTLDPDEVIHTITVTVYDFAGNSSSTIIKFPPIINFNIPTPIFNNTISDSTVTITAPTGNDITNIILSPNTTGATLGSCTGAGGDNTDPYANPVTCLIENISNSGTISVTAEDSDNGAEGLNSTSYIVDTSPPLITITAPSLLDNIAITDTTITIIDDIGIDVLNVNIDGTTTAGYSLFNCTQTSTTRVDCTVQIDSSGDLVVNALDLATNSVSETKENYIIDNNPPLISLLGFDPETVEYLATYTDAGAEYNDDVDGTGVIVGSGTVNTGILGPYSLTYDYTDSAGNTGVGATRIVNVVDTTKPVISLSGSSVETIEVGSIYTDPGANAGDNYDINLTPSITSSGTVNTSALGVYTIDYNVVDSNANAADTVTRVVKVVDTTDPIINLIGVDEVLIEVGGTYTELGASITDNYYTIPSSSLIIDSSSVDTTTVGSYIVNYDVVDGSGNPAITVTRTVIIQDTSSPVITMIGDSIETIEVNTLYNDQGATCIDNYDTTCTIIESNGVNTSIVGSYFVTYNSTDSSGNPATTVTRKVNVIDSTDPIITLLGSAVETIEIFSSYIDSGATAIDNYDGNITSRIITYNPVDTTNLGTYTVTYDVTDENTNTAIQVTRVVEVVDTTPPIITITGSNPLLLTKNSPYIEFGASCVDNYDLSCVTSFSGSVDTSSLGLYTVRYSAVDTNTNSAVPMTRTVEIIAGDSPVISLLGNNPEIVEVNTNYLDAGATAIDGEDGNISANIASVNPVDITATGSYIITYDVDDSSNNSALQVTRVVNVVDTTPPMINLVGAETINIFKNNVYNEFGAVCSDNYDTSCNVVISGDLVNTSTLGSYIVNYASQDQTGNSANSLSRRVNVISGDIPVISLLGNGEIDHEVNTIYIDEGATAFDTEDGNITSSMGIVNSVDITSTGAYSVTYDVDDFSDNSAISVIRVVNIVDTIPPLINLLGNPIEIIELGDDYIDAGALCTDNYDELCNIIDSSNVNTNVTGSYTVNYSATDLSGNSAGITTRIVRVIDDTIDNDGDGIPDTIELIIGTDPNITDSNGDGVSDANNDKDNISPLIELGALNNGDGNNDGIFDASQNTVSSIPNIENTKYNTIEIENSQSCNQINYFASKSEPSLLRQDPAFSYDLGLWDFEISCIAPGLTADIKIYLDQVYDTSNWVYRKYHEISRTYTDISSIVSYGTAMVGGSLVTTINYSIEDGGIYDEDGLRNGIIIDPSGPAQQIRADQIGGGRTYSCRDQKAVNYRTYGFSKPDLCIYKEEDSQEKEENINQEVEPEKIESILSQDLESPENSEDIIDKGTYTITAETCPIINQILSDTYKSNYQTQFTDIFNSNYRDEILRLEKVGIVRGREDRLFVPKSEITRAEFLAIVLQAHCYDISIKPTQLPFYDVDLSHWHANVIRTGLLHNIVAGDKDQDGRRVFRGDESISKIEAFAIIMNMRKFTLKGDTNSQKHTYFDVVSQWQHGYLNTGQSLGILKPEITGNQFFPDSKLERDELIGLLIDIMKLY